LQKLNPSYRGAAVSSVQMPLGDDDDDAVVGAAAAVDYYSRYDEKLPLPDNDYKCNSDDNFGNDMKMDEQPGIEPPPPPFPANHEYVHM